MSDLDILSIDANICKNFQDEKEKLVEYKDKLSNIERTLTLENINNRIRNTLERSKQELTEHINDIESDRSHNFYIVESAILLEEYKEILSAPMKVNFIGKQIGNDKEKQRVIFEYLEVAQKYVDIEIERLNRKQKIVCYNCPNKKEFDIVDGNIYICMRCSAQQVILKHISSYKDIDRVNISSKYMYDRKVHFRDCINQYQGKQNSTIHQDIYNSLEDQFERHHLLIDSPDKNVRFSRITKEHISMFLKELNYTKHYENINLIYYNFTGVRPDDISYLEDELLSDFDKLTELYDVLFKHIDRKNFINTQYVLFQLLRRHKHQCSKEDFTILKTIDRKSFHDEVYSVLAVNLGWNMESFF